MANFRIFSQGDILNFVNKRDGETKLGERVQRIEQLSDLENSTAKFVLLGIPEDIGVRANYGIGGAQTAWNPALKS
ncbi:MAG: arginase, partial [Pedobacter sp.]